MSQTNSPELHVGANVYTVDGEKVGKLRFIMVDPDTASISHLVLEKSSYVHADVMIPTDRVGQVLNRGIYLTANLGELIDMEEFPESAYTGRDANRGERQDREPRPERNDRGNIGGPGGNRNRNSNKRYRRHHN